MLMGDKHGTDVCGLHAGLRQPAFEVLQSKTAIDQHSGDTAAGSSRLDQCAVASATTSQAFKPQMFAFTSGS